MIPLSCQPLLNKFVCGFSKLNSGHLFILCHRLFSHNASLCRNLCGGACVLKCERSEHAHKRHRVNCRTAATCYAALNLNLVTDFKSTSCFACHRSYWYCIASQLSGVRPRDLDRRSAIVGLIALWQLMILFIVDEDTPKLSANALTLVP